MMRAARLAARAAALALVAVIGGCALPSERIVLLPSQDGHQFSN